MCKIFMNNKPRFDRILPLISLVVVGLLIVFLIESNPEYPLVARISNDLPVISVAWFVILLLVIIISTGADLLAKSHPALEHRTLLVLPRWLGNVEIAPLFWILPSFVVMSAFAFFRLFRERFAGTAFVLILLVCGGLLTITFLSQHYTLDKDSEVRDKARVSGQAVSYLTMFGLFSAIMHERYRLLFTAGLCALVSVPMAYRLLARTVNDHRRPLTIALLVVGTVIAEASAIMIFWAAPFLTSGILLTALFYVLVNVLQHAQNGTLDQRIGWELGLLGTIVFAVLATSTLW